MLISVTEFIGRFHPVLVHLPIGILLVGLLLQWLSTKEPYKISTPVRKVIFLCGVASALLSSITGYLLSLSGDYDSTLVALHMWMAIGLTLTAMFVSAKVATQQFDGLYKMACWILLILIFVTGHLGGSLTHGPDYLTSALNDTPDSTTYPQRPIPNVQEANVYADVVQPVLQTKCYSCHGPKKQKGGLRMDNEDLFLKGGKDGAAFISGKAEESEMIKRLLMPKEEDHHMPPKEKQQLNEKQIALLHWWIDQGASFNKKVKELPQPANIKNYLLTLQDDHRTMEKKAIAAIPTVAVEKGDEKAIQALRNKGVVIMPVAQNSNYLMANFVTANSITDKDMALLVPLKKQLVWLKLGDTNISDSALSIIGQCTNLTLLQLDNTNITDKGIVFLKSLTNLQSLNLVGTKVTAQGVAQLQTLKQLQALYLYQTAVSGKDWGNLKKIFPKTVLDSGGYVIPFLATDTTLVKPPKAAK